MKFRLIIDREKPEEVVATVRERSSLTDQIEALVLQYAGTDRIPVQTEDEVKLLRYADMECISVLDGKTYVTDVRGDRYRIRLRLYELEKLLPTSFIRINKSAIANETHLERFAATFSGAVDAVFRSGYREYVSRRCYAEIKRRFGLK